MPGNDVDDAPCVDDADWHMISTADDVKTLSNVPGTLAAELQRALDEQKHKNRSGESVVTDVTCVFPAELVFNASRNFSLDSATEDRSPFEPVKDATYVAVNSAAFGDFDSFKAELRSRIDQNLLDRDERDAVFSAVVMLLDSRFSSKCLDDVKPALGGFRVAFRHHAVAVQVSNTTVALTIEMNVVSEAFEPAREMPHIVMRLSLDYSVCYSMAAVQSPTASDSESIARGWSIARTQGRGSFAVSLGLRPRLVADLG